MRHMCNINNTLQRNYLFPDHVRLQFHDHVNENEGYHDILKGIYLF